MIDEKTRDELNSRSAVYAVPGDAAEHFYACPMCRQVVDIRKLGDVLHHEEELHKPLPVNDR